MGDYQQEVLDRLRQIVELLDSINIRLDTGNAESRMVRTILEGMKEEMEIQTMRLGNLE